MSIFFIIVSVVIFLVLWILNKKSYQKNFCGSMGSLYASIVNSHCALYGNSFALYPNYSNITFSLARKLARAIIAILLITNYHWGWVVIIGAISVTLSWLVYNARKKEFISVIDEEKQFLKPLFTASKYLPYYDTLLYAFVVITNVFY